MAQGIPLGTLLGLGLGLATGLSFILIGGLVNNQPIVLLVYITLLISAIPILVCRYLGWSIAFGHLVTGFPVGSTFAIPFLIFHFGEINKSSVTLTTIGSIIATASILIFSNRYRP